MFVQYFKIIASYLSSFLSVALREVGMVLVTPSWLEMYVTIIFNQLAIC